MAKTLEEKQNELKAKNQNIPIEFVEWSFKKGVRLPNAGRKKRSLGDEALLTIAAQPCPDQLLTGDLQGLRGQGLTMVEALQYRIFTNAILGHKDSVRYGIEILNRLYGKVNLVLTKDKDEERISKMTPEEVRDETLAMLKRLEEFIGDKKGKKKGKKKSEPEPEIVSESAPDLVPKSQPPASDEIVSEATE